MAIRQSAVGLAAIPLIIALSGCAKEDAARFGKPRFDETGVDLAALLDPHGTVPTEAPDGTPYSEGQRIDRALGQYHAETRKLAAEAQTAARNRVQDRLLDASNQLCLKYQQELQSGDFSLDLPKTEAGRLVRGDEAHLLPGTGDAAALGGSRAEFTRNYVGEMILTTILKGITARRYVAYQKILEKHRQDAARYPIESAIKDAISYHAQCSLVAGTAELEESLAN